MAQLRGAGQERKKIYNELVVARYRAEDKAEKIHPLGNINITNPEFQKILDRQKREEEVIYNEDLNNLSRQYNISRAQLEEILQEGKDKWWPHTSWLDWDEQYNP